MSNEFHKNLIDDDIHALNAETYADITARDADTTFNTDSDNINKLVRVTDADGFGTIGYFFLTSITPTWESIGVSVGDEFIELTDTPETYTSQAGKVAQVNASEDAIEFGQDLTTTGSPELAGLELSSTEGTLILNRLTTTQRDALIVQSGMVIFNTTLGTTQAYNGTEWTTPGGIDTWVELSDTPGSITPDGHVKGNSGGDALEFGQGVDTTDSPTFADLTAIGKLTVQEDSSSVATNPVQILLNEDTTDSNWVQTAYKGVSSTASEFTGALVGIQILDHTSASLDADYVIKTTHNNILSERFRISDGVINVVTGDFMVDTDTLFVDSSTSQVGIGTNNPNAKLHVLNDKFMVGNFNNVSANRLTIEAGGNIKHTFGLNDGSTTSNHGRFQILNNIGATVETGNNSGGFFVRTNSGRWATMIGGGDASIPGGLKFYTGGTSTNQTYDALSATLAMSIDNSQEVTMLGDLALDADIIHQNIAISGTQSEIWLDDTNLLERFRIQYTDSSFGEMLFTGGAQLKFANTNGVQWEYTMTNGDDSIPMFEWNQQGTNGADIQVHITDQDPVNFTADSGSLAIKSDGVNSALYVNNSAVNGNTWSELGIANKLTRASFPSTTTTEALGVFGLYACTDTSAERTLTISKTSILQGSITHAFQFTIKDEFGGAGTNHITIDTESTSILFCEAGGAGTDFASDGSHNLSIGSVVIHTGFADSSYNGTFTVTSIVSGTTYEIADITFNATSTGTVNPAIEGLASIEIIADYGDITLYSNGANLFTTGI